MQSTSGVENSNSSTELLITHLQEGAQDREDPEGCTMSDEESPVDPLESWEDGAAFGVSADKDPVCKTPVEEWAEQLDIVSTEEVPIPEKLVDQVIGQ